MKKVVGRNNGLGRRLSNRIGRSVMLKDEQIATLREIDDSVAFDDSERAADLLVEGYVEKNGDLFQLTPKGEKCLLDNGIGPAV
jgi:hypothetical protein